MGIFGDEYEYIWKIAKACQYLGGDEYVSIFGRECQYLGGEVACWPKRAPVAWPRAP